MVTYEKRQDAPHPAAIVAYLFWKIKISRLLWRLSFQLFEFSDVKYRIDNVDRQPNPVQIAEYKIHSKSIPVIGGIENKEGAGGHAQEAHQENKQATSPSGEQNLVLYLNDEKHRAEKEGEGNG